MNHSFYHSSFLHNKSFLYRIGIFYLLSLFILHLFYVHHYAVNVPSGDEWDALVTPAIFDTKLDWNWVFSFHNDHSHALTKILNFLDYKIENWNLAHLKIVNLFLIGGLVFFMFKLKSRLIGKYNFLGFPLYLTFLLQPELLSDGTLWAIISSMHFGLIFGLLSIFMMGRWTIQWWHPLIGGICAILALHSFAFGSLNCIFFSILCAFHFIQCLRSQENFKNKFVINTSLLVSFLLVGSIFVIWMIGYEKPSGHPDFMWPYRIKFWNGIFALLVKGHGFKSPKLYLLGVPLFIFILWPVYQFIRHFNTLPKKIVFPLLCLVLYIGGALALIAVARSGFGHGQQFSARYAEITLMLVPLTALNYFVCSRYLNFSKKLFKKCLIIYFFLLVGANFKNFNYPKTYGRIAKEQKITLECIRQVSRAGNKEEIICNAHYLPPNYSQHILYEKVSLLKNNNVSFLK